jgi:hypothetical protein
VDPCDRPWHAKLKPCQTGRDEVDFICASYRCQDVRMTNVGPLEHFWVSTVAAHHPGCRQFSLQTRNLLVALLDEGHVMVLL